jgi:hypothetical protein
MREINIYEKIGKKDFAENKDIGKDIRAEEIMPELEKKNKVVLNFDKIDRASQSFIHSLISDPIRQYGDNVLDIMVFKNCNDKVRGMIKIVLGYLQDAIDNKDGVS